MMTNEKELQDLEEGSYEREEMRESAGAYKMSEAEAMEGSEFDGEENDTQNMGRCSTGGNETPGPGARTA